MAKLVDAARSKKKGAVEAALDGLTANLKISGQQIDWKPPADLEPFAAKQIKDSLKALQDQVKAGKLKLQPNGDVHG